MTTSTEGRPQGAPGTDPPSDLLVVRPDPEASRLLLTLQVALLGLFVVLGVLKVAIAEGWARLLDVAWTVRLAGGAAGNAVVLARFRAADALAEVGRQGIRVNVLGRGWVALPWEAVGSIRKDLWGIRVLVRPASGVDESTQGTEWPPRSAWLRRRPKRMVITARGSDASVAQILAAVSHFSGGRF